MKLGFLVTLLGVINGFLVIIFGVNQFFQWQDYIMAGLLVFLGLLGIVTGFIYRFKAHKEQDKIITVIKGKEAKK